MCFILHWFFYPKSNVLKELKKIIRHEGLFNRVRPDVLIRKRVMTEDRKRLTLKLEMGLAGDSREDKRRTKSSVCSQRDCSRWTGEAVKLAQGGSSPSKYLLNEWMVDTSEVCTYSRAQWLTRDKSGEPLSHSCQPGDVRQVWRWAPEPGEREARRLTRSNYDLCPSSDP